MTRSNPIHAPERDGDSLKGGGHPADSNIPEKDQIDEMAGRTVTSHGKVPGIGDPGTGGSKTNPVDPDKDPERPGSHPVDPLPPRGEPK